MLFIVQIAFPLVKAIHHLFKRTGITKTLRIMQWSAIFLLGCCLQVAASGNSQMVTFTGKEVPLTTVFTVIKKQTGFVTVYNRDLLPLAKPVTIAARKLPLNQFLEIVFQNQLLDYRVEDNTVFVGPKSKIRSSMSERPIFTLPMEEPPVTVRGRVTNENGEPVVVSVLIKGSSRGTTSNDEGFFEIANADYSTILIISATNIRSQEVPISQLISRIDSNGILQINLRVQKNTSPLDEIIFKGYYSQSKRNTTGSVSKVTSGEIERQPVVSPLQALQGRMPGVIITPRTGVAGGAQVIQIRGQNSLRQDGNFPLYVIDGIPLDPRPLGSLNQMFISGVDPLNTINPENIESIEILKDADATAIYGSRGANGVVLITTKKGKRGKTLFDFQGYLGIGEVHNRVELLNTQQYLAMRREAFSNDGPDWQSYLEDPSFDIYFPDLKIWDSTDYTDWQEELFGGTASITDFQASVSGGDANTTFRIGGGFHRETTVFSRDFGYEKGTGHLQLNHISSNKKLKLGVTLNYGIDKNNLYNNTPVYYALTLPPNATGKNPGGTPDWTGHSFGTNPFVAMVMKHTANSRNLLSSANVSYEIFSGMKLSANAGYTDLQFDELVNTPSTSYPPGIAGTRRSVFGNRYQRSWIVEPQVTYFRQMGLHGLDLLMGTTWQSNQSAARRIAGVGYVSDALLGNLNAAPQLQKLSDDETRYKYNAVFGRIGYQFDKQLFINFTARGDGSSRFGPGKRFASFGAAGVAWIFIDENTKKNHSPLTFGKVRSSYGTSGNDQIGDYGYLSTYTASAGNYQGGSMFLPQGLANTRFAWEVNKKLEAAIDLEFWSRLNLAISWYRNTSSNQLVGYALPATTGFASIQANLDATVRNTGWEFQLDSRNLLSKNFRWNTYVNLTIPRNKLLSFPNLQGSSYATTYVVGRSINISKVYKSDGIDPVTGFYRFVDIDGNGTLNVNDRQVIVELGRRFYGGVGNHMEFKSFSLDFLWEFSKQRARGYMGTFLEGPGAASNQPSFLLEEKRWSKEGDAAVIQKFTNETLSYGYATQSDMSFDDVSFLRLKTVSLSYRLPRVLLDRLKFADIAVFLHGQNLLTLTKYRGLDPEIPGNSQLPQVTMITGGIKFKL